jgi:cold shock CspA family protein
MEGTISAVKLSNGYGFIRPSGSTHPSRDIFFHQSDLSEQLEFNEQLTERQVVFDLDNTPKGQRARKVQPAA